MDLESVLTDLSRCKTRDELRQFWQNIDRKKLPSLPLPTPEPVASISCNADLQDVVQFVLTSLLFRQDVQSKNLRPNVQALQTLLTLESDFVTEISDWFIPLVLCHSLTVNEDSFKLLHVVVHIMELPARLGMLSFFQPHAKLILQLTSQCVRCVKMTPSLVASGSITQDMPLFLSKICVMLYQHYGSILSADRLSVTQGGTPDDKNPMRTSTCLGHLFEFFVSLLLDQSSSRDCCVMTGNAVALHLRVTAGGLPAFISLFQKFGLMKSNQGVCRALTELMDIVDENSLQNVMPSDVQSLPAQLSGNHMWTVALSLIRGIVVSGAMSDWSRAAGDTQLLAFWVEVVLGSLLAACQEVCQPQIRYLAFQVTCEYLKGIGDCASPLLLSIVTSSESAALEALTKLLFSNWDDTVDGLAALVRKLFAELLRCISIGVPKESLQEFKWIRSLLETLSSTPSHVRGRYGFIGELVPHIGFMKLLEHCPELPADCLQCLSSNLLASASGRLYKVCLADIASSRNGGTLGEDVVASWSLCWLPAILKGLCSDNSSQRQYAAAYFLLSTAKIAPPCVDVVMSHLEKALLGHWAMESSTSLGFDFASPGGCLPPTACSSNGAVAGLASGSSLVTIAFNTADCESRQDMHRNHVCLPDTHTSGLCVSRQAALMAYVTTAKLARTVRSATVVNETLLSEGLESYDDASRVAALAVLCDDPTRKGYRELLVAFVLSNMKSDSSAFRQQMFSHLLHALAAIRDCCCRLHSCKKKKVKKSKAGKSGNSPVTADSDEVGLLATLTATVESLFQEALSSFYPGAPYQRKKCGLQLMGLLLDTFYPAPKSSVKIAAPAGLDNLLAMCQQQDNWQFCSPRCATLLHSCMEDEYAEIRSMALELMSRYFQWPDVLLPVMNAASQQELGSSIKTVGSCTSNVTTTAGSHEDLAERDQIAGLKDYLEGVLHLVESPRSGDNEIGAMLLKAVLQKLVVEQRYSISVANSGDISVRMPQSSTEMDQSPHGSLLPAYFFVEQLVNMLAERLEICRKDLLLGAKTAPMHGCVLILRHCLAEVLLLKPLPEQNDCGVCYRRSSRGQAMDQQESDAGETVSSNASSGQACWPCLLVRLLAVLQSAICFVLSILTNDSSEMTTSGVDSQQPADNNDLPDVSPSFGDMGIAVHNVIVKSSILKKDGDNELQAADSGGNGGTAISTSVTEATVAPDVHTDASSLHFQLILHACWLLIKEASLLLGDVCSLSRAKRQGGCQLQNLLDPQSVLRVGRTLLAVLLKCRLKGAIESCASAFSQLCLCLLSSGQEELSLQPKHWLLEILEVAKNQQTAAVSVTRLSAGLPLIIQSIVHSESRTSQRPLLHLCVDQLLAVAAVAVEANASEVMDIPQVHACNMLRTLFRDAMLGDEMLTFAADGIVLSLAGLASPSWAMRNASTLLFSVLLQRTTGCGTSDMKKDSGCDSEHQLVGSVTAVDFFTRYPGLFDHFLAVLKSAVWSGVGDKQVDSWCQPLPASLLPLLVFLNSMSSSSSQLQSLSSRNLQEFVPFFLRLSSCPVQAVRVLSARCLLPFISNDSFKKELLVSLLKGITSQPVLRSNYVTGVQQNLLHGTLLKIKILLSTFAKRNLDRTFISEVFQLFADRSWVCSMANPCYVTRGCAMDIWRLVSRLSGDAAALKVLISSALATVNEKYSADSAEIGRCSCLTSATEALLENIDAVGAENILALSCNCHYEVRLKFLTFLQRHREALPLPLQSIQESLVAMAATEENGDCLELILQCIASLWQRNSSSLGMDDVKTVWSRISTIIHSRSRVLLAASLPVLACVTCQLLRDCKQMSCAGDEVLLLQDVTQMLCSHLLSFSQPEQQDIVRRAAGDCLLLLSPVVFDLLSAHSVSAIVADSVVSISLCVWQCMLCLVEDDQPQIRYLACSAASKSFDCLHQSSTNGIQRTLQPNIVLSRLGTLVDTTDLRCVELVDHLTQVLVSQADKNVQTLTRLRQSKEIFLHEDANMYVEPLMLMKLVTTVLKVVCPTVILENCDALENYTAALDKMLRDLLCELTIRRETPMKLKGVEEVCVFRAFSACTLLYSSLSPLQPADSQPWQAVHELHALLLQLLPKSGKNVWIKQGSV